MKIEGNKVKVEKSAQELYEFLLKPSNFKSLMPDNVEHFEASENSFEFALKGMPKVALILDNYQEEKFVKYRSASANLNFSLDLQIHKDSHHSSFLQILFEGQFNPLLKMMVEKPLTHFIHTLEENATQL